MALISPDERLCMILVIGDFCWSLCYNSVFIFLNIYVSHLFCCMCVMDSICMILLLSSLICCLFNNIIEVELYLKIYFLTGLVLLDILNWRWLLIFQSEWFFSETNEAAPDVSNSTVPMDKEHEAVPNIEFLLDNVGRKPGDAGKY